jgi:hypothetical protein
MAKARDIITIMTAAGVHGALRRGVPVPSGLLEEWVRFEREGGDYVAPVLFREGERSSELQEWVPGLADRGATSIQLVDLDALAPSSDPVDVLGTMVPRRKMAGFSGGSRLLLGVGFGAGGGAEIYQPAESFPPRLLASAPDVWEFVEAFDRSSELRDALLWENEHNLHFTEQQEWNAFVRSVSTDRVDALIQAIGRRFNGSLRQARSTWAEFCERHRNRDFGPIFQFSLVESVEELPASPPVAEQERLLEGALEGVTGFASAQEMTGWAEHFESVRMILHGGEPQEDGLAAALGRQALPERRVRLAIAALRADVFGGMGSWNDMAFEGAVDAEYQRVSEELFQQLRPSLLAAINDNEL